MDDEGSDPLLRPQVNQFYLDLEETKSKRVDIVTPEYQAEVTQRLYMEDKRRNARRELMKQIETTEQDSIFTPPFSEENFSAFMQEQREFIQKKDEFCVKERKLKEEKELKGVTFTPKINKKSREISSVSRNSGNRSQSRHNKSCMHMDFALENIITGFVMHFKSNSLRLISDGINYLAFSDILKDLEIIHRRFIKEERKLVYDFWVLLKGNTRKFVFGYEILAFLVLLLGYKEAEIKDLKLNNTSMNVKEFEIFQNYMKSEASRRLKGHHELKRKIQHSAKILCEYKSISSSSLYNEREKSANSYRQKVIKESKTTKKIAKVEDYLLLNKEIKSKRLEYKREQKLQEELQNCTFHPTTLNHYSPLQKRLSTDEKSHFTSVPLGDLRNIYLYNLSKEKSRKKSINELNGLEQKEKEELKECTFMPKINSNPLTPVKSRCITSISQVIANDNENLVYYIPKKGSSGRKFLEENRIKLKNRGTSTNPKGNKGKSKGRSKENEGNKGKSPFKGNRAPSNAILIVNLKISNGKYEKVRFKRGEDPRHIIKQFAIKHNLEPSQRDKLVTIIRKKLNEV